MAPAKQPHDALFKAVFSGTEHARGLLESVLPEAVAAAVDWSTLALEPGSYVDASLRQSHSDLLFRAHTRTNDAVLLHVLVEHQSKPDPWMPQRLHAYVSRIWAHWRREHPRKPGLPPVVPVVVHHGAGGWRRATSLAELYGLDPALFDALGPHLPALRFVLYDLGIEPVETLARTRLTDLGQLALLCLKRARQSADMLAELARWLHLIAGVLAEPGGVRALSWILAYILQATPVPPEAVLALVEDGFGERGKEAFMLTGAQQLVERGRIEGRVEGEAQGAARMLLVLLHGRFGELPVDVVNRVNAAEPAQLEAWAARLLSAGNLEDLFADPR